ncbi:MAG: hypothetical protein Q7S22_02275 [Candidatus Micrarchaeota archaeon]|nr:hypothetical protein [Candidatus Micrarchaeota archaeon]
MNDGSFMIVLKNRGGIVNVKSLVLTLFLLGLSFAAPLNIPADQPICNLYGLIRLFGTVVGVLVAAYSGFHLATSHEMTERNNAKALLGGVIIGLIVIWIAPIVVTNLVGSSSVCGWTS